MDPVEEDLARIGQRIRRWREEAGYTLQQLATRSGVAAGTIQKVETQQMTPTIAVLMKIARGLDRLPSELIREEASDLEVVVSRAKERQPIGMHERGQLERLSGDLFEPAVEVWEVELQPGHGLGGKGIRYEGDEFAICEEGQVTFRVADDDYVLGPRDCIHFKAVLPHSWRNDGDVPTRFVILGTVPRLLRAAIHDRGGKQRK